MNKIKSITTYTLREEDEELVPSAYEERDQLGNITMLKQYNYDGEIEGRSEYEFDDKSRVIVERQYTSGNTPDQTIKIEYNESGKAHQVIVEYADGSFSTKSYTRNEEEKSTTIDIVDQDGEAEGKEYRKFDSEDRVLEEVIYDEEGAIESKAEIEYDDYGNVTESVRLDNEGFETVRFFDYFRDEESRVKKIDTLNEDENVIRNDEYEYDEKGNQTKHTMKNLENGSLFIDLREYDEKDNEIGFERLMGDRPIEAITTTFDANGLMVEQETRRTEGVTVLKFKYEFF